MIVYIGHSNYAMADKIMALLTADESAVRRLRSEAKEVGRLIHAAARRWHYF